MNESSYIPPILIDAEDLPFLKYHVARLLFCEKNIEHLASMDIPTFYHRVVFEDALVVPQDMYDHRCVPYSDTYRTISALHDMREESYAMLAAFVPDDTVDAFMPGIEESLAVMEVGLHGGEIDPRRLRAAITEGAVYRIVRVIAYLGYQAALTSPDNDSTDFTLPDFLSQLLDAYDFPAEADMRRYPTEADKYIERLYNAATTYVAAFDDPDSDTDTTPSGD